MIKRKGGIEEILLCIFSLILLLTVISLITVGIVRSNRKFEQQTIKDIINKIEINEKLQLIEMDENQLIIRKKKKDNNVE